MSESKPFLNALKGVSQARAPFWFMRQAGRYLPEYREIRSSVSGFLELCYTPSLAAEVTLQPIRRFNMDAAILFSDILVVPHALGRDVTFVQGEGPKLNPITRAADIQALEMEAVAGRTAPVMETVRRVKAELPPHVALIGFAGSPWTVACYMIEGGGSRDFQKAREFACVHKQAFALLMDRLVEATLVYLRAQIEAGAEALQLFDSWAGILSEQEFGPCVIEPTRRIVAGLKQSHPHIPIIGFPRRAGLMAVDYAFETGVDAISLDEGCPLDFAASALQTEVIVQGNLDPILLKNDIEAALEQAARICRRFDPRQAQEDEFDLPERKPFIFNLGHGILQHTPVEHVQALSDFLLSQ